MVDVEQVLAPNPGPFTLEGTSTWLVGRDPCWVVDPGPDDAAHVAAVLRGAEARGGVGGIVLTHGHDDHRGALPALEAATGVAVTTLRDGERAGPLLALATPGHSPDHVAYLLEGAVCSGDAVLGRGSVFVAADLGPYLAALERLLAHAPFVLLPGHGPLVEDGEARVRELLAHRRDREARLLDALAAGLRSVDELLDRAWADAPAALRLPAAWTLGAHLEKLAQEGRLPEGVERPALPPPPSV